jgi:hypothetical protein
MKKYEPYDRKERRNKLSGRTHMDTKTLDVLKGMTNKPIE